jgi:hypothetical protein
MRRLMDEGPFPLALLNLAFLLSFGIVDHGLSHFRLDLSGAQKIVGYP